MKKYKNAALILLPFIMTASQAMAEDLHYNIVEFNESASVSVPQDTMNVVLVITETNKDRQLASNAVSRRANALITRIKNNKAFEAVTENRRVYPEYDDKQRISSWKDSTEIRVKSMDFNALNQLIADSQNDAMIGNLYYSVSPKKYAEAVEQASQKALKSFRDRAESISHSLGFNQYKLVKIRLNQSFENNTNYEATPMAASLRMNKLSSSPTIMDNVPGNQEIQQTVEGSIQM